MADNYFKIIDRPGARGAKPDALSRWLEYRAEKGAEHNEQSILKPEHFGLSLIQADDEDEGYVSEPELVLQQAIRLKRLSAKATLSTKGSQLVAGHDIYAINKFTIPAQGQVLAATGIAIVGLPNGTYARIAPRSILASKKDMAINGGVIYANYIGEVKIIIQSREKRLQYPNGDRIAQLIIKTIDTSDMMEVDDLEVTERAEGGFETTDMSPKRATPVTDCQLMICFLQANQKDNEYFYTEDMGRHPRWQKEHILMSSAIISQVETRNFDAEFISKVLSASEKDLEWQKRKAKLE